MIDEKIIFDIQKQTERSETMLQRLDTSIEKLTEVSQNISKLLAVHEEKFENQQKQNNYFNTIIEQRKNEVDEKYKDLKIEMKFLQDETKRSHDELEKKISKFERLAWMLGGGGMVIGFIMSNSAYVVKIFT